MKVIIDLIEDIRESIGNTEAYTLRAGLLREDADDTSKLIYAGEAPIGSFELEMQKKELLFSIDSGQDVLTVGALIPQLLILDMAAMMYPLRVDVNRQYEGIEVVGFGKSDEERVYTLFIKI